MHIRLDATWPAAPVFEPGIRRAPSRGLRLDDEGIKLALRNALRYLPTELHAKAAPEFLEELRTYGRIYAYRWRPQGNLYGRPIDEYEGNCVEGKAFQVQIDNNLDFAVALYPYELVTYGETGSVCANWLQYQLIMKYLRVMTQEQTLVVMSGHPLGLFPSRPESPRVIITNALMIGRFDNQDDWERAEELGVANYGQMTAGGWMYIGPQGIVHGTFNTLLTAGRQRLGIPVDGDLSGRLFISSGLGGMSGAQPKAAEIAKAVGIIAEVDQSRIQTRLDQGWIGHSSDNLDEVFRLAQQYLDAKEPASIAYHGNIVDLLQYAVDHQIEVPLLSDQTSCHAQYDGGYCPEGMTFEQRTELLA
ncbi:urocanate hydratase, partial [Amycolatopsis sp. H6(2020)]|nr:urocanate hydratase [Amycolatopsis sp. H6(2020)]